MRSSVLCNGQEVGNRDAHMVTTQAETTTSMIQQDVTVFDPANVEAEAGLEAICNSSSFNASSFTKTLRNLQSLEIPAPFVKQHGGNFQAKVVLQGPSGRLIGVHLKVESTSIQDRVHFRGPEWRQFLRENEFEVRHEVVFSLVSKSTFIVRHSNANIDQEIIVRHSGAALVSIDQEPVDRITEQPNVCHGARRADHVPEGDVGPSEKIVEDLREPSWTSRVKSDVVYGRGDNSRSSRERVDMLVGDLQCPHFVVTINKSHLREWKSCSLRVPREFHKKYAAYFSDEANIFQGPSGRMMKIRFADNSVRFTGGWKAFHRENNIKLGDVLLFSLCEPARWLVQFVERKSEEIPTGSECAVMVTTS